jgi:hypothetical protein
VIDLNDSVAPDTADKRRVHFSPMHEVKLIPKTHEEEEEEEDGLSTPTRHSVSDPAQLLQSLKRQLQGDLHDDDWREIEAALNLTAPSAGLQPVPLTFPPPDAGKIAVHHRRSASVSGKGAKSWLDTVETPWNPSG